MANKKIIFTFFLLTFFLAANILYAGPSFDYPYGSRQFEKFVEDSYLENNLENYDEFHLPLIAYHLSLFYFTFSPAEIISTALNLQLL